MNAILHSATKKIRFHPVFQDGATVISGRSRFDSKALEGLNGGAYGEPC